jgi:hypothetical protein
MVVSMKNQPAFPQATQIANEFHPNYGKDTGMSLRDYFAAQALTGAQIWDAVLNGKEATQFAGGVDKLAQVAYAVADAMLKARQA